MTADFIHLHTHSHYSFLDGAVTVDKYIEQAEMFDMPALAITDHGNICNAIEFFKKAQGRIKPIIGFEAYTVEDHTKKEAQQRSHLLLLAMNHQGYKNLIKLTSAGYRDGFYYKPTIDKGLLQQYNEGIICSSACMQGEIQQHILRNDFESAEKSTRELAEIFQDRFYLEVQNHFMPEDKIINEGSRKLAEKLGLKLVATSDCHYLKQEDAIAHDVLLCIGTASLRSEEKRLKFPNDEFYFKSPDEMKKLFENYPDAIENTLEIADRCNLVFPEKKYLLPQYDSVPEGQTSSEFLENQARQGCERIYGSPLPEHIEERMQEELAVINNMGFPDYFLVTADFINWSKNNGVIVGPGRGSAAGSIVSYALSITDVDPLQYDLLFERFLNKERISMPDIDVDFDPENRDRVYDYVKEKYGENNVCHIITYGKLKARAVVRDVARVLEIPLPEVDKLVKFIPPVKANVKDAMANPELKKIIDDNPPYQNLFDIALKLESLNRHSGVHAAGVIIAPGPLDDYVPLLWSGKEMVTQFSMDYCEQIGLLKMDFLGLNNLSIIQRAVELVEKNHGIKVDFSDKKYNDKKTFELLNRGEGLGIFQIESDGMCSLLKSLKPDTFEDIIAIIALYRPGPIESGMIDTYINVKHGKQPFASLHPLIDDIIKETNGVIIYQEQVIRIAQKMGGLTLAQADNLRKAMGKKNAALMDDFKGLFIKGAKEQGVEKKTSAEIFDIMAGFAAYGFNKSHSTAYAVITYQTAYLKAHYPLDYMAALLTSKMDGSKVDSLVKYMREVNRQGIEIKPPNINVSDAGFAVKFHNPEKTKGEIVFGMAAIKGVGEAVIDSIVAEREKHGEFNSIFDFVERNSRKVVNRGTLEAMIKAGAFDMYEIPRERMIAGVENLCSLAGSKSKNKKQKSFDFGAADDEESLNSQSIERFFPEVPPWTKQQMLSAEREVVGMFLSCNPLKEYEDILEQFCSHSMTELEGIKDDTKVIFGGIISDFTERVIQKGRSQGQKMATFTLNGLSGQVHCVCFSDGYNRLKDFLQPDQTVMITGRISERNDAMQVIVDDAFDIADSKGRLTRGVSLRVRETLIRMKGQDYAGFVNGLNDIISRHRGNVKVYFSVDVKEGNVMLAGNGGAKVNPTPDFEREITDYLGKNSLRFHSK